MGLVVVKFVLAIILYSSLSVFLFVALYKVAKKYFIKPQIEFRCDGCIHHLSCEDLPVYPCQFYHWKYKDIKVGIHNE